MFLKLMCVIFVLMLLSCKESVKTGSEKSTEVILYNWKEYTSLTTLKKFEKETGIKVILKEFETLGEQLSALQSNPQMCDLTILDSYIAQSQYLELKVIKELDPSKLLHEEKFLSQFKPFMNVGVPYSYGVTGFAIDTRYVKEDYTDYKFLVDPRYKNRISLLDDPADTFLAILLALDQDINDELSAETIKKIEDASKLLMDNNVSFNETFTNLDKLVEGEKWIVQTYSGDAVSYQQDHDYIKFMVPKKRFNVWSEIICMTVNSPNQENAYKLLNFLSREQSAAAFSNEFYYANGIVGSGEFMDEEISGNELVNIPQEIRSKGHYYKRARSDNSLMQRIFNLLKSTSLGAYETKD